MEIIKLVSTDRIVYYLGAVGNGNHIDTILNPEGARGSQERLARLDLVNKAEQVMVKVLELATRSRVTIATSHKD